MKSHHDWNLVRLILDDVNRGDDETSKIIEGGYAVEAVVQHIRFCVLNGLLLLPEQGGEVFEPAFSIPPRLTEKGKRFLEAIGAETRDDDGEETFESFDPQTGILSVW